MEYRHNLVGGGEQRRRHTEAQHTGDLRVDDQLELGGLNDGQVCRFRTFEDSTGVDADLPKGIANARLRQD